MNDSSKLKSNNEEIVVVVSRNKKGIENISVINENQKHLQVRLVIENEVDEDIPERIDKVGEIASSISCYREHYKQRMRPRLWFL